MTPPAFDEPTLGEVHRTMTAGFDALVKRLDSFEARLQQDYVPRSELDVRFKEVDTRIAAVASDLAQSAANRQWTVNQWLMGLGVLVALVIGVLGLVAQ